ncbi:MAG: ABC transporter permease [Dehalococcoidia bacterium]|nr:ABC transporter permease [Dehalococcoidia bacterium]MDH5781632.1 ABC transporter permease [Dehalococcoidia bacterium]
MMLFSWRFIRMWQRNRDVFFRLWHSEAPGFVAEPIIILLAMGVGLGAYVGLVDGQKYIEFIAPGIIASYAMFSASFECTYGSFVRMEYQKTYDAIIATPLNVEDVIAGEIFWGATRSFMTGTVILAIAAAFQLVPSPWASVIPVLAFLEGIMFASIAILFTSIVPSIYSFNYYFTLFITPMFFFSGVFFPLSSFPQIVQTLSWIAPLTPVVHLTRALINGEFHLDLLWALALIIVLTALFFSISLVTMRRRLTV